MILAWLWRRLIDNSKKRGARGHCEPRRLVYALPQGSVVEPLAAEVRAWLERLGLSGEVGLDVWTGVWRQSQGPDWREDMHQPAIIIGTTEILVSKALMRGLGVGPGLWPIDFALVTNGAHWVVHSARLSRQAVATLRQLLALAGQCGTAEPLGLTVLSCASERVRVVPRLRGVERAALDAAPGELLAVTPPSPPALPSPSTPAVPPAPASRPSSCCASC